MRWNFFCQLSWLTFWISIYYLEVWSLLWDRASSFRLPGYDVWHHQHSSVQILLATMPQIWTSFCFLLRLNPTSSHLKSLFWTSTQDIPNDSPTPLFHSRLRRSDERGYFWASKDLQSCKSTSSSVFHQTNRSSCLKSSLSSSTCFCPVQTFWCHSWSDCGLSISFIPFLTANHHHHPWHQASSQSTNLSKSRSSLTSYS